MITLLANVGVPVLGFSAADLVILAVVAIGVALPPWVMLRICQNKLKACNATKQKYRNQLLEWKNWRYEIQGWIKDYQEWVALNCECPAPEGDDPPDPPSWPNGGWGGNGDNGDDPPED